MSRRIYTPEQRVKRISEYNRAFKKANYKCVSLQVNVNKYADVLQKLDSVPNKVDYIVSLIRADIIKNGIE